MTIGNGIRILGVREARAASGRSSTRSSVPNADCSIDQCSLPTSRGPMPVVARAPSQDRTRRHVARRSIPLGTVSYGMAPRVERRGRPTRTAQYPTMGSATTCGAYRSARCHTPVSRRLSTGIASCNCPPGVLLVDCLGSVRGWGLG